MGISSIKVRKSKYQGHGNHYAMGVYLRTWKVSVSMADFNVRIKPSEYYFGMCSV